MIACRRAVTLCALVFTIATTVAHAQSLSQQVEFNIASQRLATAIVQFSEQAHVQIISSGIDVTDQTSPGVIGQRSVADGLSALLKGTGLRYKALNDNTVSLQAIKQNQGSTQTKPTAGSSDQAHDPATANGVALGTAAAANTTDANLSEIVVTAQKREERLQRVPISISVMSGSQLESGNVASVNEALNTVPGVATQQNYLGGGTVIAIRGVAPAFPTLGGSSPIAYYLDSVPFGLIRSAIAPDSDPYDMQRVEVLRGPQGTLYGASALNGVVRVLTYDPDLNIFDFKARVSDSYTQYGGNNNRADAAINVPIIEGKLAIRAVVGYDNEDGWIDQPDKRNANWSESNTYRIKVAGQPTDDFSILLSAWSSRENAGAPNVGYTFDKDASSLVQPTSTDYDVYAAKLGYQFSTFSLSSATGYLDYSNKGQLGLDIPGFGIPGSIFFAGESSNIFSEEVNLNSTQAGDWRWSVGGMYRRATETRPAHFTVIPVPASLADDISKSYAAYGELTRVLLDDRLELTAGVRHFHDDIDQEEQLGAGTPFIPASSVAEANTPRAVVTWHLTDREMIYASYSQGFRSGFPQDASVPVNAGIAPATPDRLRNYELGSKGSLLDGRVVYDASVYYMYWQGIQQSISVYSPIYEQYIPAIVNSQAASGLGTDLALSIQPLHNLTLKATVSWNNLEMNNRVLSGGEILFRKGDRPNSSPETTGSVSADYVFDLGIHGYQGTFSVSGNYTSAQDYRGVGTASVPNVQAGDPMVFTRSSFSVDFANHWTASFYGDNLNNERGSPVKAYVGVPNWDAQVRPRTLGLQAQYRYR